MSDATPVEMAHDLGHYLRPMRRHLKLIACCTILGLILGVAAAVAHKATYTASAKVLDQQVITDGNPVNGRTSTGVNMDTEAQLVKSLPVAELAAKTLDSTASPGSLIAKVTVTVPPNTTILKIAFAAHSKTAAIAGANAVANAYLQNRQTTAVNYQNQQLASFNHQLNLVSKQLVKDQSAFRAATPHSPSAHDLGVKIRRDNTSIAGLSTQLTTMQGAQTNPGSVTSGAAISGSGPNQTRAIFAFAGLVLGLLAGIGAAALRERTDKTVRYEDDLTREGVRLLAEIKTATRARQGKAARDAEALARSRAVQRMAASIGAALGDRGGSIFLAELSVNAMNNRIDQELADELSRFGSTTEIVTLGAPPPPAPEPERVVVATQSIEAPSVEVVEEVAAEPEPAPVPEPSLIAPDHHASSDMLGWPSPGKALVVHEAVVHEEVAPPPPPAPIPVPEPVAAVVDIPAERAIELPQAPPVDDMSQLLQQVETGLARARYVILTNAEIPKGSEAYVLASLSQVTVVVTEVGVTTRLALADLVEQIEITPSRVLGGLLWRPPTKRARREASAMSPLADVVPESSSRAPREDKKRADKSRGDLPARSR